MYGDYQQRPGLTTHPAPRPSGAGIASLIIGLILLLLVVAGLVALVVLSVAGVDLDQASEGTMVTVVLSILFTFLGSLLGSLLGIGGLMLKRTNRFPAGLGLLFNGLVLLVLGLFFLITLMGSGAARSGRVPAAAPSLLFRAPPATVARPGGNAVEAHHPRGVDRRSGSHRPALPEGEVVTVLGRRMKEAPPMIRGAPPLSCGKL
ncbi:MAG: hypothetical protein ACOY93_14840 [Bacillota bacterium]